MKELEVCISTILQVGLMILDLHHSNNHISYLLLSYFKVFEGNIGRNL